MAGIPSNILVASCRNAPEELLYIGAEEKLPVRVGVR